MAVNLTEKAAKEVKKILDEGKYDATTWLRVGGQGGGWGGLRGVSPAQWWSSGMQRETD